MLIGRSEVDDARKQRFALLRLLYLHGGVVAQKLRAHALVQRHEVLHHDNGDAQSGGE